MVVVIKFMDKRQSLDLNARSGSGLRCREYSHRSSYCRAWLRDYSLYRRRRPGISPSSRRIPAKCCHRPFTLANNHIVTIKISGKGNDVFPEGISSLGCPPRIVSDWMGYGKSSKSRCIKRSHSVQDTKAAGSWTNDRI